MTRMNERSGISLYSSDGADSVLLEVVSREGGAYSSVEVAGEAHAEVSEGAPPSGWTGTQQPAAARG